MKISHIMSISNILIDLCSIRQNIKLKNTFCRYCLQCFSSERVLQEHREICLKINSKESVKLESGSIKFKNYFKQIAVPFKIFADIGCNSEKTHINNKDKNTSYTERYQNHIPCSFPYKLVCTDDKFSKPVVLYKGTNATDKLIEAILEEYEYCKQIIREHFNKNLIMSKDDEKDVKDDEKFQSSNKCLISKKLFTEEDKEVSDHDHITGKYRGSAHSNCNINLKLTKKVPVILHNLRSYDSHLIMQKVSKSNVEISVIPNGLEKYMAFTVNNSIIDSMQFINSSLEILVKNLPDNDFKHLSQECNGKRLKLIKQKGVYPYEYMTSFEKFSEDKLPNRCDFYSYLKDECIGKKRLFTC